MTLHDFDLRIPLGRITGLRSEGEGTRVIVNIPRRKVAA